MLSFCFHFFHCFFWLPKLIGRLSVYKPRLRFLCGRKTLRKGIYKCLCNFQILSKFQFCEGSHWQTWITKSSSQKLYLNHGSNFTNNFYFFISSTTSLTQVIIFSPCVWENDLYIQVNIPVLTDTAMEVIWTLPRNSKCFLSPSLQIAWLIITTATAVLKVNRNLKSNSNSLLDKSLSLTIETTCVHAYNQFNLFQL